MTVFNITTETQPRISYLSSLRNIFSSDGDRDRRQLCDFRTGSRTGSVPCHIWSVGTMDQSTHWQPSVVIFWHPCGHRSRGTHSHSRPIHFFTVTQKTTSLLFRLLEFQFVSSVPRRFYNFKYSVNRFALFTWLQSTVHLRLTVW